MVDFKWGKKWGTIRIVLVCVNTHICFFLPQIYPAGPLVLTPSSPWVWIQQKNHSNWGESSKWARNTNTSRWRSRVIFMAWRKDLFQLERWGDPRRSGHAEWRANRWMGEVFGGVRAPMRTLYVCSTQPLPDYLQHLCKCLMQRIFWCLLHVWTDRFREPYDLILQRTFEVHMAKRLQHWTGLTFHSSWTSGFQVHLLRYLCHSATDVINLFLKVQQLLHLTSFTAVY